MKNQINIISTLLLLSAMVVSCQKDEVSDKQPQKPLPISGHYVWDFSISGLGDQRSHHIFKTDTIEYIMEGPVYNTDYIMIQKSYSETDTEKRWIGVGKGGGAFSKTGVWFVVFIKDITENTVTLYKHECPNGQQEAENFPLPPDNATADYGWNIYHKQ